MKNIIKVLLPLMIFASCTKDISEFNVETKRPAIVPGAAIFGNAVKNLSDRLTGNTTFRLTVKHWAVSIYQDEARYNFTTARVPQSWWTAMYQDVLNNLQSAHTTIEKSSIPNNIKANQLAIIDIMQVYTFHILVSTFGDVPYKEALDATQLFPKYDNAASIYEDLFNRLNTDIANLNPNTSSFSPLEDIVYQGNTAKWIKFANSLKIKMAMTLADLDDNKAKLAVEAAATNAISSPSDDAFVRYPGVSPNTHPLYQTLVLSLRTDYVSAKDLLDNLVTLKDPRLDDYFRPNNNGEYIGGIVGAQNTFSDVAKPSAKVSAANASAVLMDYSEIEFYLAEARARNYNVGGTVAEHYNKAISASILSWGGTPAQADTYLAQPKVAYETASGDWRQKIGFQKWISLYSRPFDAWTEIRRFDFPKLSAPIESISGFPNRFTYPSNEQQLNNANYNAASAAIGGDKVETKLFWDIY